MQEKAGLPRSQTTEKSRESMTRISRDPRCVCVLVSWCSSIVDSSVVRLGWGGWGAPVMSVRMMQYEPKTGSAGLARPPSQQSMRATF